MHPLLPFPAPLVALALVLWGAEEDAAGRAGEVADSLGGGPGVAAMLAGCSASGDSRSWLRV